MAGVETPPTAWCFWAKGSNSERQAYCSVTRDTCEKWERKALKDGGHINIVDVGSCYLQRFR